MKQVYRVGNSDDLNPAQALLLLEASESHCAYAIADFANLVLVHAAHYAIDENDRGDLIKAVIAEHAELRQPFRQTVVGYCTTENVLIPSKTYHYDAVQPLLQSLYGKGQNAIVSEVVTEWQLHNAYYVPSQTHGTLNRQFATGNFWHMYSIFLKNKLSCEQPGCLFVDFKTNSFSLLSTKGSALLLAQTFEYTKAADVLYWLLKTCKLNELSQNDVRVVLSGLVDKDSAVLKMLEQYFFDIAFAGIENDIRLSASFDEFPVHFFSSFFKLAICVS